MRLVVAVLIGGRREQYSHDLRVRLLAAAKACGEPARDKAVYATTQGPRLETAAEADRLERYGADISLERMDEVLREGMTRVGHIIVAFVSGA